MSRNSMSVGVLLGLSTLSCVVDVASAAPQPADVPSLRALDIQVEIPGSELEIYGFSPVGTVVLTPAISASTRTRIDADDAHGPLLRAFVLAETDSGPTACRWIAGWADVTARGIFRDAGQGTLADASGMRRGSGSEMLDSSSMPRWYLALRPR